MLLAKVIAVMNEKGGVGKSVTATTLACLLAKRGYKAALIDFDGQGHASIIFGVKNTNKLEVTIKTLFRRLIENMGEVKYVKFVKEKLNWYKPKAVRRVEIEKYPGSGTYRPLGFPQLLTDWCNNVYCKY